MFNLYLWNINYHFLIIKNLKNLLDFHKLITSKIASDLYRRNMIRN